MSFDWVGLPSSESGQGDSLVGLGSIESGDVFEDLSSMRGLASSESRWHGSLAWSSKTTAFRFSKSAGRCGVLELCGSCKNVSVLKTEWAETILTWLWSSSQSSIVTYDCVMSTVSSVELLKCDAALGEVLVSSSSDEKLLGRSSSREHVCHPLSKALFLLMSTMSKVVSSGDTMSCSGKNVRVSLLVSFVRITSLMLSWTTSSFGWLRITTGFSFKYWSKSASSSDNMPDISLSFVECCCCVFLSIRTSWNGVSNTELGGNSVTPTMSVCRCSFASTPILSSKLLLLSITCL